MIIDDQTFSSSYDLALPLSPSPAGKLDRRPQRKPKKDRQLAAGGGDEPNHTTARKPGHLLIIQHSLIWKFFATPFVPLMYGASRYGITFFWFCSTGKLWKNEVNWGARHYIHICAGRVLHCSLSLLPALHPFDQASWNKLTFNLQLWRPCLQNYTSVFSKVKCMHCNPFRLN